MCEKRTVDVELDDRFRAEAELLNLRCTCEYCAYFVTQADRCAHGWPGAARGGEHRLATLQKKSEKMPIFCKEFELA